MQIANVVSDVVKYDDDFELKLTELVRLSMLCVGVDQRSANLASIHLICTSLLETNRLGTVILMPL